MQYIDFKPYDDCLEMLGYDGYIDQEGNFYKVKKCRTYGIHVDHELWAQEYLKTDKKYENLMIKPSYSLIYALSKLEKESDVLVQMLGFVYYSHDCLYYKPIIKYPDPKINGQYMTERQKDTLFNIMLLSKERYDLFAEYVENNPESQKYVEDERNNVLVPGFYRK